MSEVEMNEIAEKIFTYLVTNFNESDLECAMTLIDSIAYTSKRVGLPLNIEENSFEDQKITEYVNARINAFNNERANSQAL